MNTRPLLQESESEADEEATTVTHAEDPSVVTKDVRPILKVREPNDR